MDGQVVSSAVEEEKRGLGRKEKRKSGGEKRQGEGRRQEVGEVLEGGGRGEVEWLGCFIQDHQLLGLAPASPHLGFL